MTITTTPERTATDSNFVVGWHTPRRRNRLRGWRFASRLARREVRRRPGRTILVVALIAVPILAMTLAIVLARTGADTSVQEFERTSGTVADLDLQANPGLVTDAQLRKALPAGSRWVRFGTAGGQVRVAGDAASAPYVEVSGLPLDDRLTSGIIDVRSGRAPRTGEVLLSEQLARKLDVGVGDTLRLDRPEGEWRVSGVGRPARDFRVLEIVFGSFASARVRPGSAQERILIDVPGRPGTAKSENLLGILAAGDVEGAYGRARAVDDRGLERRGGEVDPAGLAWGWVAGVLVLVALGIIIAAAFATSARRQLVTLGQLSTQGATAGLTRLTLALQGTWSGILGSVVGIGLALGALLALRDPIEFLFNTALGPWRIRALDLAVIGLTGMAAATIAALVPARSAARIPVLAALNGRRPLGRVPRRLVPIGLALFGGGLALIAVAVAGSRGSSNDASLFAAVAVVGGLGVMFGMCCASPLAVDVAGRIGGRLRGSWRLAARSIGRLRTRSAGVVTAIGVAGALAIVGSTVAATQISRDDATNSADRPFPADAVQVTAWFDTSIDDVEPLPARPLSPELRRTLTRILPGATVTTRRVATFDLAPGAPVDGQWPVVADAAVLDVLGLSDRDRRLLRDTGVMDLRPPLAEVDGFPTPVRPGAVAELPLALEGRRLQVAVAGARDLTSWAGGTTHLITQAAARELGFTIVANGAVIRTPADLTREQQDRLEVVRDEVSGGDSAFLRPGEDPVPTAGPTEGEWTDLTWRSDELRLSPALVQAAIIAPALLFTLLVVAIGLALSATESRDERDVLIAVGARPRTLRRMAGVKATVLTAVGVVLAVPTGLLPAWVALSMATDAAPVRIPWVGIGLLVFAVPVIAGLVAWLASSIAQRVRPVHASTLAAD